MVHLSLLLGLQYLVHLGTLAILATSDWLALWSAWADLPDIVLWPESELFRRL